MGVLRSSAFIGRCEIDTHAILVKSPVLPWSTSPASIVSTNVRIFQGSVHGIRADFHFGPTPGAGTLGLLAPIPTSVIPANGDLCVTPPVGDSVAEMAEHSWRGTPNPGSPRERRAAAAHPTIVIPTTAGIHGSHIVIPATAGIHGPANVSTGTTDGGGAPHNRRSHNSGNPRQPHRSFPRRRESTAGGRRWVPVSTGTTDGGGAPHNRHSPARRGSRIHGGGPAMGSRLHGNERRRRTPQSSFPPRTEIHGGGRRWVPVSTGTTGGGGAPHNRHSHNSGNPRQPHRHSRRARE